VNTINVAFASYLISAVFHIMRSVFDRKSLGMISTAVLGLGLLAHTIAISVRWHMATHPPLSSLYESMILFAWLIVVVYSVVEVIHQLSLMRPFVVLVAILVLIYSYRLNSSIRPLMPALQSHWLGIHVVTNLLGYAFFVVSFIFDIGYLVIRRGRASGSSDLVLKLDASSYRIISLGIFFLALGIITGSVWAEQAWGSYWSWDPKETWALVTCLIYAVYLHLRVMPGWRGRRRAWLAVAGFLSVIFTYIGVSLLPGLH